MSSTVSKLFALALATAATSGCAHTPQPQQTDRCLSRRVVTGSRIPQLVDARTGVPATVSPVFFYEADELRRSGRDVNLADAMRSVPAHLDTHVAASPAARTSPPPADGCERATGG
jgi:hypothetical protein